MTATQATERPADPAAIWRVINGYTTYWIVVAAVGLGVFDELDVRSDTIEGLAVRLGCDRARLQMMCDTLVGLGLLERDRDGRYGLVVDSATFLVAGRERSMRELLLYSPGPHENWPALADTIRGAPPPVPAGESFSVNLVQATFPTQRAVARALVSELGPFYTVLDLGAGAAPWTVGLLEGAPGTRATVNDLPGVLPVARAMLREHDLAERCAFLEGDYHAVELPQAAFDVAVCAHVLRLEGPAGATRLLQRAAAALRPGGTVVIADYFLDDDRRGPLNALLLGMTMTAAVPGAATYTRGEVGRWLTDAGFEGIECRSPLPFQDVMIARTPSGGHS
jgi:ubiquinone/menaquinone biosynthesis C-methylase UbiE